MSGLLHTGNAHTEEVFYGTRRDLEDLPVVACFTVEGEPASKSRARFVRRGSKVHAFTPEKTKAAEEVMKAAFLASKPKCELMHGDEPTFGVVAVFFCATRQRRDVDNMTKLILDGLNGVAWDDDVQVTEITARKEWIDAKGGDGPARTSVLIYRVGSTSRPTGTCAHCGKKFRTYASWQTLRKYCSDECHLAARQATRMRTCKHCAVEFDSGKPASSASYCSKTCAYEAKNTVVECDGCGKEFKRAQSLVRAKNYCTVPCGDAARAAQRIARAAGTCGTCGGPTSKKKYTRCRACAVRASRKKPTHHQSKEPK